MILSHAVAPHAPGELCAASQNTLLFVDTQEEPRKVRWIDCSRSTPKILKSITTQQDQICEMIFSEEDSSVIATADDCIHAYNTSTSKTSWKNQHESGFVGITSDGGGNLFISTVNSAIKVLSPSGEHRGYLVKEGEQRLGKPLAVRWCEMTSSLIVAHRRDGAWFLSDVKVFR